jgi:hypothetical protein
MIREVQQNLNGAQPAARSPVSAPSAAPVEPRDSAEISGASTSAREARLAKLLQMTRSEAESLAAKLPAHVEGEVLVKLKPTLNAQSIDDLVKDYGATLLHHFDVPDSIYKKFGGELVQLKLPEGMTTAQGIAVLGKDPRVAYAASNDILHTLGEPVTPNDLDPRLYGLHNTGQNNGKADADIDAPEAWSVTTGNRQSGPVIAVIDTGVDYNHEDLKDNIWTNPGEIPGNGRDDDGNGVVDDVHGYNAINDTGNPMDDHSHGTHVSGTIGATGNNGKGVVGVQWQARIMGAKFLSGSGSGTTADAIKAVLYATRNGARITSNSWGGGGYNQALYDALKASPALHIFAAGNESNDNDRSPAYPASYNLDNLVAVAASDRNDQLADFSNWGRTSVDLAAPGVDILSTVPGNRYRSYSGTSMATPHVAGVAGLIATKYPEATNEQIKARLLNSVDPVPAFADKMVSGGRLNAANALEDDTAAPAPAYNFGPAPDGVTATSVRLQWTASGDDCWNGQASGYRLRVADRPIVDGAASEGQISFDEATPVPTGAPGPAGTQESATVRVMPSGQPRTLYFALKITDNVGNASPMASAAVEVPAATVAFEDNLEQGAGNWTAENQWGVVEVPGRGKVLTDSPNGNYDNNRNDSITSRPISLTNLTGSTLMFEANYDLENNYDKLFVEVSEDGQTWNELARYTGGSNGWQTYSLDLSAYDGKEVRVRFRQATDGSIVADGTYIDNVVIAGSPKPPSA